MKNLFKVLIIGVLIGNTAIAGVAPTNSNSQDGTSLKTHSNITVPNSQMTDLGGLDALIETGNKNVLKNPSFEHKVFDSNWTLLGSATDALETTTVIDGKKAAKVTITGAGDGIAASLTPIINTYSQKWEASCNVNTSMTNIQVCATIAGAENICQPVSATSTYQPVSANFTGPINGTAVGVKVKSVGAGTGTVYVDDCYVGPARNLSQVSQSSVVGQITQIGGSGTCTTLENTSTGDTNFVTLTTTGPCNAWTTAPGSEVAPVGTVDHRASYPNMPSGTYEITVTGPFGVGASSMSCNFRLNDGSGNTFGNMTLYSGTSAGVYAGQMQGTITYTGSPTSRTFSIEASDNQSSSCYIDNSSAGRALTWTFKRFPNKSDLAVSSKQQWQPTQTIITASGCTPAANCIGSTYNLPANVSRIEVEMAGGGGGGGGSGSTTGTSAGDGGQTTFGGTLLVANGGTHGGGSGGANGPGGTATISAPAFGIATTGGAGGYGTTRDLSTFGNPGPGGTNAFGGGSTMNVSPAANTGAGGAGAGSSSTSIYVGAGGGAGGYIKATVPFPSSSYAFAVGTGGVAGGAGTNGGVGSPGAGGVIKITEYYNTERAPMLLGLNNSSSAPANFMSGGDGESGANICVPYADAAGVAPVDGVGGSPTVSCALSGSSPISGTQSYVLTKPASNVQGQGWAFPFTIDQSAQAKMLQVSFDYQVDSNYTVGSDTSTPDMVAYVYGPTDGDASNPPLLTQLTPYKALGGKGTLKFQGNIQTSLGGTAYRLILHEPNTGTLASSIKVDNIVVSPVLRQYGTPVTDWQYYTPASSAGFGNITSNLQWRRNGSSVDVRGSFVCGTSVASEARISLPNVTSDSTLPTISQAGTYIRHGNTSNHGGMALIEPGVSYATFSDPGTWSGVAAAGGAKAVGNTICSSGETLSVNFSVPVQGWSSSTQMSDQSGDNRTVAGKVTIASISVPNASETTLTGFSLTKDATGSWNPTTGIYTAPAAGWYLGSVLTGTGNVSASRYAKFYVNNVAQATLQAGGTTGGYTNTNGVDMFYANSGDPIKVNVFQNSGASETWSIFGVSIFRLGGNQQIQASETVAAAYSLSAGVAYGAGTTIVWDTKEYDTHNMMNASGVFTIPSPGKYQICAAVYYNGSGRTEFFKNGSQVKRIAEQPSAVSGMQNGCLAMKFVTGDTFFLQGVGSGAQANPYNYISVERIGN